MATQKKKETVKPTPKEELNYSERISIKFIESQGFIKFKDNVYIFPNNHHSSLRYHFIGEVDAEYIRMDETNLKITRRLSTVGDLVRLCDYAGDLMYNDDNLPF